MDGLSPQQQASFREDGFLVLPGFVAPEACLAHAVQASLDRVAISKALSELAILTIRRRD